MRKVLKHLGLQRTKKCIADNSGHPLLADPNNAAAGPSQAVVAADNEEDSRSSSDSSESSLSAVETADDK